LLSLLKGWRRHLKHLVEAVKKVEPRARVYLAGGAAEDRLTVLSDIDVLVVLPEKPGFNEAARLRAAIWEEAENRGVPAYLPFQLHIIGREDLERYRRSSKLIRLA